MDKTEAQLALVGLWLVWLVGMPAGVPVWVMGVAALSVAVAIVILFYSKGDGQ